MIRIFSLKLQEYFSSRIHILQFFSKKERKTFIPFSGRVAWGQKFEDEAAIGAIEDARGARQAVQGYVPTFYTSAQPQASHQAQPVHFESQATHPAFARSVRDTYYEQPLYYYTSE